MPGAVKENCFRHCHYRDISQMSNLENFTALGVADYLIPALLEKGFKEPTDIQSLAIPLLLSGEKDIIGQALTGTGKTAAFGLPILQVLERGISISQ